VPAARQRPAGGAARAGRQGARAPLRRTGAVAARDLRAHGGDREREARRERRRPLMASKTLLVAQREYLENIRTKTFWIGILAFPAIFAISIGISWLMQKTKAQQPYAVLDFTATGLGARIEEVARANDVIYSIRRLAREKNLPETHPMLR